MKKFSDRIAGIAEGFKAAPYAPFLPGFRGLAGELDAAGFPEPRELGGCPRHLNEAQLPVAKCASPFIGFLASNRVGKSFLGALLVSWKAHGLHPFREEMEPTDLIWCGMPDLKNHGYPITKPLLRWALGPTASWKERSTSFTVRSEGHGHLVEILLKPYESGAKKYQGAAPGLVWFDELPDESIYDETVMRAGVGVLEMLWTMTLIPGYDIAWFINEVYEPWVDDDKPESKAFFSGNIFQNKHLNQTQVDEIVKACGRDEMKYKARVLGEFEALSGRVYNLKKPIHTMPDFAIPGVHMQPDETHPAYTLYRCADVGLRSPAPVLWVAVSPTGLAYVYREYYPQNKSIPDICHEALEMETDLEKKTGFARCIIDPAAHERDRMTLTALIDLYAKHGMFFIPGNNKRQFGIDRMTEAFAYVLGPDAEVLVPPKITFFHSCTKTWEEHRKYAYPERKARALKLNPKEDPKKSDDHTCDALRYGEATGLGFVYVPPAPASDAAPADPTGAYRTTGQEAFEGDEFTGWA